MNVNGEWHSQPGDLVQAHAATKLPWIDVCLGLSEREDMDSDQEHEVVLRAWKYEPIRNGWVIGHKRTNCVLQWRAKQ